MMCKVCTFIDNNINNKPFCYQNSFECSVVSCSVRVYFKHGVVNGDYTIFQNVSKEPSMLSWVI